MTQETDNLPKELHQTVIAQLKEAIDKSGGKPADVTAILNSSIQMFGYGFVNNLVRGALPGHHISSNGGSFMILKD